MPLGLLKMILSGATVQAQMLNKGTQLKVLVVFCGECTAGDLHTFQACPAGLLSQ